VKFCEAGSASKWYTLNEFLLHVGAQWAEPFTQFAVIGMTQVRSSRHYLLGSALYGLE
jgi:hypothetical protein